MMQRTESESGFALLSALLMAVAAGGVVLVMSVTSMSSHQLSQNRLRSVQARYLAEGSIEVAKLVIKEAVAKGGIPPTGGNAIIDGITVPYTITPVDPPNVETDPSGIQTTIQSYEVVAAAFVTGVRGRAGRIVNARWTPLFQYAVFFEQGLDILPTPNMLLTGRIHTNGDLRIGCNSGTLTLDTNHIRAVGKLRRWKKHSNVPTVGDVLIRNWVNDPFNPAEPTSYVSLESLSQMTGLGIPSTTGYDSLFPGYDANGDGTFDVGAGDWLPFDAGLMDRYSEPPAYLDTGNTLLLGAQGVTRATPPPIDSVVMFEPSDTGDYADDGWGTLVPVPPGTGTHKRGHFHENADLAITVSADGTSWTAVDGWGFDVTADVTGAVTIDQSYDKRQGGFVRVAKVDVGVLNTSIAFPANGLLYVGHYGMGTGTDSKGVHLVNGSDVSADLTVVTQGSAYIQGDYNTNSPVSSAVIADAVNLLSNSWTNTTTKPTASSTTYNVAMIVGNTETITGQYNGGLENYPRFHENWTGKTCKIVGSMISAWANEHSTGLVSNSQYNPPIRDYGYDARFNDVTLLPPFTPMIATVVDVVRY